MSARGWVTSCCNGCETPLKWRSTKLSPVSRRRDLITAYRSSCSIACEVLDDEGPEANKEEVCHGAFEIDGGCYAAVEKAIQAGARVIEEVARAHSSNVTLFAAVEGPTTIFARTPLGRQLQQLLHDSKDHQLQQLDRQLEAQLGQDRVRSTLVDAPSSWHD